MKDSNKPAIKETGRRLVAFFNNRFDGINLPSHNLEHHIRVWTFAVEIIRHLRSAGHSFSDEFIDGLHIACMTHDMGMAFDNSEMHGRASRELTQEFLSLSLPQPANAGVILTAVENHDRKDYTGISDAASMATILSVADDLDAFGYIGVYRYIEIYLKRGVPAEMISEKVRPNMTRRYMHMEKVYGFMEAFFRRHARRYEKASDFFNHEGPFPLSQKKRIMQIILGEMQKQHEDISDISRLYRNSEQEGVAFFFNSLHKELLLAEYL